MFQWVTALGFSALGSVGGLLVSSVVLFLGKDLRARIVPWLVSYAVGTMLGAALLGLLPEALDAVPARAAAGALLAGVLTFFVIERLVLWHHWHGDDACDVHKSTATLLIVGESLHTFVDGVAIAAAVMVSTPLGLTTTLAIVAHEIPQEAGDFAILLAAGYSRRRAIVLNLAAALGGVVGAAAMLLFGEYMPHAVPYVLAFAAGNFLYVAMADLIPSLHRGRVDRNSIGQAALIGLGVLTIAAF